MLHTVILKSLLVAAAATAVASAAATSISGQGDWETTLHARDLDQDGKVDAYFDSTLNISWLAYASISGELTFDDAVAWAGGLDVAGVTGWHLPTINTDVCHYGPERSDCLYNVLPETSDMAHMNMITLGNESHDYDDSSGVLPVSLLTNSGPFFDLQPTGYWFSRDYAIDDGEGYDKYKYGWRYSFYAGAQDPYAKDEGHFYAWAVHDGDVGQLTAVPEPQSYALLLAGLGVMSLVARRRLSDKT